MSVARTCQVSMGQQGSSALTTRIRHFRPLSKNPFTKIENKVKRLLLLALISHPVLRRNRLLQTRVIPSGRKNLIAPMAHRVTKWPRLARKSKNNGRQALHFEHYRRVGRRSGDQRGSCGGPGRVVLQPEVHRAP